MLALNLIYIFEKKNIMFMVIENDDITIFWRERHFRWIVHHNLFVWSSIPHKNLLISVSMMPPLKQLQWYKSRFCSFCPRSDKGFGATTSILYLYKTEVSKTSVSRLIFSSNYNVAVLIVFKLISPNPEGIFKWSNLSWTILLVLLDTWS